MNNVIEKDYIIFDSHPIHIIIDDKFVIWFNAKNTTAILGYKFSRGVIIKFVDSINKTTFNKLSKFTTISKDPQTIYINEGGLYSLLLSSKKKKAKIFRLWVTNKVIPSIREKGFYELKKGYEKEIESLVDEINAAKQNKILMQRNLTPDKFPNGGVVYAVDFGEEKKDNEKHAYKIGKTIDMKKRKALYDSHSYHKRNIVIMKKIKDPVQLENILRASLKKYRYKDKKDVYLCTFKQLDKKFSDAIKFIKKIDKTDNMTGGFGLLYEKLDTLVKNVKRLDKLIIENKQKYNL